MLIRGGLIHTMEQAPFVGDILVRGDRIAAVSPHIDPPEDGGVCILEARGLTVLPGLIDVHIHDGPEVDGYILQSEQASGVTAGLLWPEGEGACKILRSGEAQPAPIYTIHPEGYTDAQLHARILSLAEGGMRVACEIHSAKECRRILQVVHSSRVKVILAHLHGCEDLLEAIALSGCAAIIGVSGSSAGKPWAMAGRLVELGTSVALTCGYPNAKLRYLPLCAALCVRDGMDWERALHTVTTAPAAILRLPDAGRIAEGCRADFAIYDGDPLLLATSHVMTIAGGKMRH